MAIRAVRLPFDTAVPALSFSARLRRAAPWGLLVSKLLGGWGVIPGRTGGVLHIFALLPAVVMAALDPRRRPRLATVGYAATLFVAVAAVLSARPAFAPLVPGPADTLAAFALTLVAAVIGATVARRLSDFVTLLSPSDHGDPA